MDPMGGGGVSAGGGEGGAGVAASVVSSSLVRLQEADGSVEGTDASSTAYASFDDRGSDGMLTPGNACGEREAGSEGSNRNRSPTTKKKSKSRSQAKAKAKAKARGAGRGAVSADALAEALNGVEQLQHAQLHAGSEDEDGITDDEGELYEYPSASSHGLGALGLGALGLGALGLGAGANLDASAGLGGLDAALLERADDGDGDGVGDGDGDGVGDGAGRARTKKTAAAALVSVCRRNRGLFCGLVAALLLLSTALAFLALFRTPFLRVVSSSLHFDTLGQVLTGTQLYELRNDNFLGIRMESLELTVYYLSHDDNLWYEFDDTGQLADLSQTVGRQASVNFSEAFRYRIRSRRVTRALFSQCLEGHLDLAFHGSAEYRFAGRVMQSWWGPSMVTSNCSLFSSGGSSDFNVEKMEEEEEEDVVVAEDGAWQRVGRPANDGARKATKAAMPLPLPLPRMQQDRALLRQRARQQQSSSGM